MEIDVTKCEFCKRVCKNTKEPTVICLLYGYCSENQNCCYKQLHRYKQAIEEIKELAAVNAISTCWAFLNECDRCKYKDEDDFQCPQTKLKEIFRKCKEVNKQG